MSLSLNGTNGLSDVDGSAATPAIRGTDANTGIFFPAADTIAFSEGGAEAMRIKSNGDVNIGTTDSTAKLTISGKTTSNVLADVNIYRTGTPNLTAAQGPCIQFSNEDATNSDYGIVQYTDGLFQFFSYNNSLTAWVGAAIGIGLTSSVASVNNNQNGFFIQAGDGNLTIAHSNSYPIGYFVNFQYGGAVRGAIEGTSGGAGVAYTNLSDYRLKENIAPMTGALAKVAQLKPCTYTWKSNGHKADGFIAHELQEVLPDAVTGQKDAVNEDGSIKPQGIDTSYVVATLTAAIQEQQTIINDLKARIETLETK